MSQTKRTMYPKMKASVKKLWVAALRSGKYKQVDRALMWKGEETRYCCLGVLEQLYQDRNKEHNIDGAAGYLSHNVCDWAKIEDDDGGVQEKLVDMNDQSMSFKRIATWIEKNL